MRGHTTAVVALAHGVAVAELGDTAGLLVDTLVLANAEETVVAVLTAGALTVRAALTLAVRVAVTTGALRVAAT